MIYAYLCTASGMSRQASQLGEQLPDTSRLLSKSMHFCYIDESGTPQVPGNTSHYVLTGIAIPVSYWKVSDKKIGKLKIKYGLDNEEIHTAWIARNYLHQSKIPNFETLGHAERRYEVQKLRNTELLKLQKEGKRTRYKQARKNYKKTDAYIHLTRDERSDFLREIADLIGSWGFARIFGEAIDKLYYDPVKARLGIDEQALEQLVSRFEQYLSIRTATYDDTKELGALIHDNNDTVARKHTQLMKKFHSQGTFWRKVNCIIETPLFVDSELTSLVQIADLCSYAIRRYLENQEDDLFNRISPRIDRKDAKIVGVRHFSSSSCNCLLCTS